MCIMHDEITTVCNSPIQPSVMLQKLDINTEDERNYSHVQHRERPVTANDVVRTILHHSVQCGRR